MNRLATLSILVLILAGCTEHAPAAAAATTNLMMVVGPESTPVNLQAAYSRTTRDIEMLARFARKADDEGYAKVASLFRATVKSRQIHLAMLDAAIRAGGAIAKAESLPQPEVRTTRENLATSRDAAATERDKALAAALSQASEDKNNEARKAFLAAREALYEHMQYCKDALADLDSWKKDKKTFYVCRTCGYLLDRLTIKRCPVDNVPPEQFEAVN